MKDWFRRFKIYGIGFGIGCIFTFFFVGTRGCDWTPENRVKKVIVGKLIVVSQQTKKQLAKKGFKPSDVIDFLSSAEIDFDKSKKEGQFQVYQMSGEIKNKPLKMWFAIPKDAFVAVASLPSKSIYDYEFPKDGLGEIVFFPLVKNIVAYDGFMESTNENDSLFLNSPMLVHNAIKKNGKLDFTSSNLYLSPERPIQSLRIIAPSKKVFVGESIWYKDHIQFSNFYQDSASN